MRKEIIFGVLAISFMVTSCATIISGTKQSVRFTSNPSSATIFIDEVEAGKTPFEMQLTRNSEHSVKMKLDGYQTYQTRLTQTFNAWCLGNVVLGGLIGIAVDASTGALYNLSPGVIDASMSNGTTDVLPAVNVQDTIPKVEHTKDQMNVGDNVKFFSYKLDIYINGVVKEIKGENLLIEYTSFGKIKTVEISKTDIKRI